MRGNLHRSVPRVHNGRGHLGAKKIAISPFVSDGRILSSFHRYVSLHPLSLIMLRIIVFPAARFASSLVDCLVGVTVVSSGSWRLSAVHFSPRFRDELTRGDPNLRDTVSGMVFGVDWGCRDVEISFTHLSATSLWRLRSRGIVSTQFGRGRPCFRQLLPGVSFSYPFC